MIRDLIERAAQDRVTIMVPNENFFKYFGDAKPLELKGDLSSSRWMPIEDDVYW